ncbi:hypothetical protein [Clostridium kluyveri]|uniref:Uncharacterized protein n=2 Tax=Clostridium kluyveri TaxID=1534 RepID=A5N281_CLOK5|nr:hypothetical protein [Clostridium kluyveri]EDK35227.1 Hypothetical protein CKL_3224 [Clostridium kluyveri DSM 555]
MAIRCKECIFKDIDGGEYPCNDCSEIMDIKGYKGSVKSHFTGWSKENINAIKNSKEKLKKRLENIINPDLKIHAEFSITSDGNVVITAFSKDSIREVTIYQITDTGDELIEKIIKLDSKLFTSLKKFIRVR